MPNEYNLINSVLETNMDIAYEKVEVRIAHDRRKYRGTIIAHKDQLS